MSLHPPDHNTDDWVAKGHLLLQMKDKGSKRASFHWVQRAEDTHLSLIGPLGSGRIELVVTAKRAHLSRSDGFEQDAATPEALLALQEWPIPIIPATYWLQGLSDPAAKHLDWGDQGVLRSFESQGWQIEYLKRESYKPYYPKKIKLTHLDYVVTIIINRWESDRWESMP